MSSEEIVRNCDSKMKVADVLKEAADKGKIEVIKFVRFKVGEGI